MSRIFLAAGMLTFATTLILVGCSGSASCASDEDCFNGEVCVDGTCAVRNGDGDAGTTDAADTQTQSDATDTSDLDSEEDGGTEDATEDATDDATDEDTSDGGGNGPACVVDRFTAECPDTLGESNESPTRGFPLNDNNTVGCPNRDEFKALSESHSTWLCSNEEADWYKAIVYPCDETSFVIEAKVTPRTQCSQELWEAGPSNYECSDQNVSCAWEGESYVVRRIIEPGLSGLSYYFGIEKTADSLGSDEGLQLEYDVTFETRR
jgi:hypothetical protein